MSKYNKVFNKVIWFLNIKSVYGFVSLIGLILRVILLPLIIPEPFQALAEKFITQFGFHPALYEFLLRVVLIFIDLLALSHIFHFAAFVSAGNSYKKYSEPAIGSACYTIYYSLYFIIASLIVRFFYWWVILICLFVYIGVCWGIYALCIYFDTIPGNFTARFIAQCVFAGFVFAALITIYCVCK